MANDVIPKIKVMHAPLDIGANAYYLAQGERQIGLESKNVVYWKQWYNYPADYELGMRPYANPMHSLKWWKMIIDVALNYDVIHFNFGNSFLTHYLGRWAFADLPLWRNLGIPVFVTFQGCEGRISSRVLKEYADPFCSSCPSLQEFCAAGYDDFKQEVMLQASRYSDQVFAVNPDILRHLKGASFLPYSNCDIEAWKPSASMPKSSGQPVKVLHAPTNRALKGTATIIEVIESLKREGENVELCLIEKVPHSEAKKFYESSDLLIDQIHIGWYGGLAVELMALAKPVMAYICSEDLRFIPEAMRRDLPVVSVNPKTLKEQLRKLIRNPQLRDDLGRESRLFVEKWHAPEKVAGVTAQAYKKALVALGSSYSKPERVKMLTARMEPLLKRFGKVYLNSFIFTRGLKRAYQWMKA
jgi:glycosyltransferase involved in cell wall biosynthesis